MTELGRAATTRKKAPRIWQARTEALGVFDAMREKDEQRYREAVASVKGIDAGFQRFCEAAALEPEKLLAWDPLLRNDMANMREHLEADIPADEEFADAVYQRLRASWPERKVTAKGNGR